MSRSCDVLVFTVAVTYSLETATRGTHSGTLFTERGEIYVPRILQNFTNKTTIEAHTEILQNFKFLLESDSTEPPVWLSSLNCPLISCEWTQHAIVDTWAVVYVTRNFMLNYFIKMTCIIIYYFVLNVCLAFWICSTNFYNLNCWRFAIKTSTGKFI